MRTVLMAFVVLWCCLLAIILPVILGQQVQNKDKGKTNKEIWNMETKEDHSIDVRHETILHSKLPILNLHPFDVHLQSDHTSNNETTTVMKAVTNLNYFHDVIDSPSPAANQHNLHNSSLLDVSSNKSFTTQYDEIFEEKDKKWNSVVLTISSPDLFQTIHIVMTQVHELLSPGFVIQRVKGNISWLEEVKDHGMDCYFSGTVLEQQNKSTVALSLCDGVRGVIQMNGERYYIQPENQGQLPQNIFSKTSFTSVVSSYLKHYKHIITKSSIGYPHLSSHCSITANFKHHRLKGQLKSVGVNKIFHHSINNEPYRDLTFKDDVSRTLDIRQKRSVGVSLKHTVETLVVADAKMYEYHGEDVENYVLTLMSIVKTIYQSPSIRNFIDVVVVKLIIYEKASETPFKVNQSAAATLKNFCQWQHKNKEMNTDHQYDTAILLTREDICRAPGKCDTLGLAELGTICDKLRSCSLIEDNGISAAFTIAHELGHVFNLPHDDDKQCSELLPHDQKLAFHVMAPTLDYNASPWDWSNCSAKLMTEFLESGLATCLHDGSRVKTWMNSMQALSEPGWTYSVNKQCKFVFGEDFVICPYSMTMNNPLCRRLWCTNTNDNRAGCRTKHMPWADGTPCGENKVCQHGACLPVPEYRPKPMNGGWGPWKHYGPCSRTCGGGVKTKYRECDNPVPENGGNYCLGPRVRYKSCNIKKCPIGSRDFREVQCDSDEMKRKYRLKDLPSNSTWTPKFSGVHMKDLCKLYCSAANSTIYLQFSKKVIDGTKCSPFTDDICVNGQCWAVGCDNKLGSKMKRDKCGVCGGDNLTCRTVTGIFNNAIYGYNLIGTIPRGATHIDIRQYGQIRHTKDDDNYLALQDSQKRFILNGEYTVRTEPWKIKIRGAQIEYSGSEEFVERINTTMMIEEDISVFVLSVGKLNPPNITYSYLVSVTKKVVWKNFGWKKCSSICNGEKKNVIRCVREEDNVAVPPKRCNGLERPKMISERCNTDCKINWKISYKEDCPVRCGKGMRRQLVHCVKQTSYKNIEIINDKECLKLFGAKPDGHVPCEGQCLATYWIYTEWSTCSTTCGDGIQQRQAKCVDEASNELLDAECAHKDKELQRPCKRSQCAEWTITQWTGCSVTCGVGFKQRKVWCLEGNTKVDDDKCSKKKPVGKKECTLKECPQWFAGGWGPCSATCGKGLSMRAVKCRIGNISQDDGVCDASMKLNDRQNCFIGPCPAAPFMTTTDKIITKGAFWRAGMWSECSAMCDSGTKYRVVSCTAYNGSVVDESECTHLQKPANIDNCFLKPCGNWRIGEWSDCSVTCGEGLQIRYVVCTFNDQRQDEKLCDVNIKPETEIRCNRGTCLSHNDLSIAVITSNKVVGTSHWRVGPWSSCSSTCGSGWERRVVICSDEKGPSNKCDTQLKPEEFKACYNGTCPVWKADKWSNCSATDCDADGIQKRLVVCQLPTGEILAFSYCDPKKKLSEIQSCKAQCNVSDNIGTLMAGPWSGCTVTCGQGIRVRNATCHNSENKMIDNKYCNDTKFISTKKCFKGHCPKWHLGKWSQCSVSCGTGDKKRTIHCMDHRHKFVNEKLCAYRPKPAVNSPCFLRDCSSYKWQVGAWSECSKSCGFGRKHRSSMCLDVKGNRVSSHLCDDDSKPKVTRRCSEFPCPFMWTTGQWSECSRTCGEGKETRKIICQAVTKEGWILPGEVQYGCRLDEKPASARYCNNGDCDASTHWEAGPWGQCSASCGSGLQRRQVMCVDNKREKTKRKNCFSFFKPPRLRSCFNEHCYATSCKELKQLTTIRKDGDYQIKIGSHLVRIYCKDMRKKHPKEYITLIHGPSENYAEMFDKKLKVPSTCPYDGKRPEEYCTKCRKKIFDHAGNSTFSKIRINLASLTIITTDTEFTKTHFGNPVPYASGGDCYSSSNCPQGRFSINLVDTGFVVSINTTWTLQGNRASQRIWRLRDGQIIRGVCGGHCGVCSPNAQIGLKLELLK